MEKSLQSTDLKSPDIIVIPKSNADTYTKWLNLRMPYGYRESMFTDGKLRTSKPWR